MPVPDSYSRRYGREESTYTSYTRGTRSSYLSSYSSAKQSTSLPPRPPSLYGGDSSLRKYGEPTTSYTSRYLTSTTSSRLRDYGTGTNSGGAGGYRTSVSPVRGTTSPALRTSIADRIKAMEIDGKDDDTPYRSYSRYSTLRNRDTESSPLTITRAYTSAYSRDRSNSREYGISPLSAIAGGASSLSNSHSRDRDSSLNRAATEKARKRSSPSPPNNTTSNNNAADAGCAGTTTSPTKNGSSSRKGSADSTTVTVAVNGQSSSEVTKPSSSSSTSESASTICASNKKGVNTIATSFTINTTKKPLTDNSDTATDNSVVTVVDSNNTSADVVIVAGDKAVADVNTISESSRACNQCTITTTTTRDFENNDVSVDCNNIDVDSSPIFAVTALVSGDTKTSLHVDDVADITNNAIIAASKEDDQVLSSTTTTSKSSNSSYSSANNNKNCKNNSKHLGMVDMNNGNNSDEDENKKDSVVVVVVQDSRMNSGKKVVKSVATNSALKETGIGSGVGVANASSTASGVGVVEGSSNNSSGALATEQVPSSLLGSSSSSCKSSDSTSFLSSSSSVKIMEKDSNGNPIPVDSKPCPLSVSLPRRRSSSTVKASELPSSTTSTIEHSHSNGNIEPGDATEDSNISKLKMNSYSTRQTNSPSKSGIMSGAGSRVHRKSGSPAEKLSYNHHSSNHKLSNSSSSSSTLKNEEDSSSSVEEEQSEKEISSKKAIGRSSSGTPKRSVGSSTAGINSGVTRKSKSKSPSPRITSTATASSQTPASIHTASKHLNGSEGSAATDNVNGYEMGPHTSKFAYVSSVTDNNSSSLATTNRNDKKNRYAHLSGASAAAASDSSDNDSDAFSSSPQLGGRFRSRESRERAGLTGLRNIGNTCFMNSVLQCLSNTKPLLEYVIRDNYQQDINTSTSAMKGSLIRAFSEVIQELWREQRVVDTSAFKDQIQRFAPRFMGYSQQDAQEFLRYLLEGLHEDVNRVTSKPTPILTDIDDSFSDSQKAAEAWKRYLRYEDSRIVDIFVGQLRSTLKCTVCGNCSVTFDPFWDLSLPIPARTASTRLAQCFELFNKEEVLDGDEKPTCSKCQCRRKCTKSFSIQKFPRILVIHLKRFSPTERYRGKLSTLVDCPINSLDLSPYAANRGQALTYNLYGVANHSGSTYSGHYIAYCKHPYTGEWHSYNDSRVSPISSHQVITTEGYVLFYEQAGQSS